MSPLMDPCTPMSMPAGSTHVHTCRVCTHACTHRARACMHAPGLCTLAPTGSPCPLARGAHARLLAPGPHACSHRVPTPTSSPCTHAPGPGPHAHSLTGPMHARTYALGHACMLAPGPHACLHEGSLCMHALGLCMHAHTGPPCPLTPGPHTCSHRAPTRSHRHHQKGFR